MIPTTPSSTEHPPAFERLRAEELQASLSIRSVGRRIICHDSVGSTNDEGMRLPPEDAPHGTVVFAEQQTAGRGRQGRKWISPPGLGLWFSVILSSKELNAEAWALTCAAGVAVLDGIRQVSELEATLKWPNDVLLDDRKLAGILTERRADRVVVGIGVNVNHLRGDFPEELRETAISLRMVSRKRIDRADLARSILEALEARVSGLDPDRVRRVWKERSGFLGQHVRIQQGKEVLEGIAEELNSDGSLGLRLESGERLSVHSGDAHLLTPVP